MSASIQAYLASVEAHLQAGNATEHTHRSTLQNLLQSFMPEFLITNEPRRIACGSPDLVITKAELVIGHLEAKDVGVNLDKAQKSEQLSRYLTALNNLLLTDYLEFRWFVEGEFQADMTVKLAEYDAKKGVLKPNPEAFERFELLLKTFVETQIITLRNPEELAQKMAHITRQINHSMLLAYYQEEQEKGLGNLHSQLNSFRQVLVDTLAPDEFTDMAAQTISYGLFAAKCRHISTISETTFSRFTAAHFITKTNPFLRNMFDQFAGIDLDERLVWAVDHLISVLNRTDIKAILADFGKRTRQEDPVVHFYETFLSHYDPQLREVRGVYYTPEPVVSYIVRSVDAILKDKFALKQGLADNSKIDETTHTVQILDPATGTGTFLYAVFANIFEKFRHNKGMWSDYVSLHLLPRVHGFELLMAAYTVAHMKLGLQLEEYGYDFKSNERLRVFLTNTLDEAHKNQETLLARWLSNEANAANFVKAKSPVMVILGNPPYSGHSANTGQWINDLLHGMNLSEGGKISGDILKAKNTASYFDVDGVPLNERNPKWLKDDYVKFIRFAQWRIQQTGYGILGFVTNHGYLENTTFRGMRQALMQDFDEIYILDLHGNSKKKEFAPDGSIDNNVFDIQQGVAIGIFVKYREPKKRSSAGVYHAHLHGKRALKYQYLMENSTKTTQWTKLQPQAPHYLFAPQNRELLAEYEQGWKVTEMMPVNSVGIVTARDSLTIHQSPHAAMRTLKDFIELDTEKARLKYNLGVDTRDWKVALAQNDIKEHGLDRIMPVLYRPFDTRFTCYTGKSRGFICMPRTEVMQHMLQGENLGLLTTRKVEAGTFGHALVTEVIAESHAVSLKEINYLFPLFLYPSKKTAYFADNDADIARKPNFSPEFIKDVETRLNLQFIVEDKGDFQRTISALDIFHYAYAIFHSPRYRQRYAEFLKIDFPRLPLTRNKALFQQLADLGEKLVEIHLMKADLETETHFPIVGNNIVDKVAYKENRVYINKTQYFDNVKSEVWEFQIGGYQVCQKWLKDRKGQALSYDDCMHYFYILSALAATQELMKKSDTIIPTFPF